MDEQLHIVGKNRAYYELYWGLKENPTKQNSWNWAAFFLTTIWFAYRKMYKLFFVFSGIELLWTCLSFLLALPLGVDIAVYGMISILVGWQSNRWYYKHTQQVIKRSKTIPEPLQHAYKDVKGGTHVGISVGLHLLFTVVVAIVYMGLLLIPTPENVIDVVRLDYEGIYLEEGVEQPTWSYIKEEKNYHVIEFSGFDYVKEEDVRIRFHVFFKKDTYDWASVSINGQKLSKTEVDDYWIGEEYEEEEYEDYEDYEEE